jgi:hypothetical protein
MIAHAVAREIHDLLAAGTLSQRKIAQRLGVSRGTVNAIALGRRPVRLITYDRDDDDFPSPAGPPRRCPTCGGMVLMPCLLCQLRGHSRSMKRVPTIVGI